MKVAHVRNPFTVPRNEPAQFMELIYASIIKWQLKAVMVSKVLRKDT